MKSRHCARRRIGLAATFSVGLLFRRARVIGASLRIGETWL
ncbi:MAG: hypothetical protein ABIP89_13460 [Polyangiaceae bacterium]